MNKKIKIIDIFQKYSNNEELPKKIKYDNTVFELYEGIYTVDETCMDRLADHIYSDFRNLNDEVEILEDNTEDIEELKRTENVYDMTLECYHDIEKKISNDELADKINEIIRYIKRKDKNND